MSTTAAYHLSAYLPAIPPSLHPSNGYLLAAQRALPSTHAKVYRSLGEMQFLKLIFTDEPRELEQCWSRWKRQHAKAVKWERDDLRIK